MLMIRPALLLVALSITLTSCTPTPVDQARAAAQLQSIGGKTSSATTQPGAPITSLNLSDVPITDATLATLGSLPHLQKLDLGHTQKLTRKTITDAGLVHVAQLAELRRLSLGGDDITDSGVSHLAGLSNLESLNLERTRVSDASIPVLARLTRLQRLKLKGTAITEAGRQQLRAALPHCQVTS